MSIDLNIITINNSMHQLDALPVGESVFILFSAKPSLDSVRDKILLTRVDDGRIVPFSGDPNAIQMSYVKEVYGSVPFTPKLSEEDSGWLLEISPNDILHTNSTYYLFIDKGLAPEPSVIEKTVSLGKSNISIIPNGAPTVALTNYILRITQTSNLANGQHNVGYILLKDGIQVDSGIINIAVSKIERPEISIVLNKNVPFISGEEFSIDVSGYTPLLERRIQKIKTFNDITVIKTEDNGSQRLNYEDINKFYEKHGWGKFDAPKLPGNTLNSTIKYINESSFIVQFDKDINLDNVSISSISANFSYAFGNYMLPKMKLYNEDEKYIIEFKKELNSIRFKVSTDINNEVPEEEKYLIREWL